MVIPAACCLNFSSCYPLYAWENVIRGTKKKMEKSDFFMLPIVLEKDACCILNKCFLNGYKLNVTFTIESNKNFFLPLLKLIKKFST